MKEEERGEMSAERAQDSRAKMFQRTGRESVKAAREERETRLRMAAYSFIISSSFRLLVSLVEGCDHPVMQTRDGGIKQTCRGRGGGGGVR